MRQVSDWADRRNKGFCIHCGAPDTSTRDHVPSKVFLDEPLPPNLPVTPCCPECNAGFSPDELYLACLLECVVTGSADGEHFERLQLRRSLQKDLALRTTMERAREDQSGTPVWNFDRGRVDNVVVKLARGHAAFELNEPQLAPPDRVWVRPLHLLNTEQRQAFEGANDCSLAGWPEVGSRAFNRLLIAGDDAFVEGWLDVQSRRYRYCVTQPGGVRVRMVIRDYLACDVEWQ